MTRSRTISVLLAFALAFAPLVSGMHVVTAHGPNGEHRHGSNDPLSQSRKPVQSHDTFRSHLRAHLHGHLHDHGDGHDHGHIHSGVHGHSEMAYAAQHDSTDRVHDTEYCELIHLHAGSAAVVTACPGIEHPHPVHDVLVSAYSHQTSLPVSLRPIARGPPLHS